MSRRGSGLSTMSNVADQIASQVEGIAKEWAREYGGLMEGAAQDIQAFFTQTAHIATEAAVEGDQDAIRMIKLAGYSMVTAHRIRLARRNRATVQRGVRLLVGTIQVLVAVATGGIAQAAGAIVREATQ